MLCVRKLKLRCGALICLCLCRYLYEAPISWGAVTTAVFIFTIFLLIGYTGYKSASHINKVEDDFHKMQELKVQAEAADVAKSQVS